MKMIASRICLLVFFLAFKQLSFAQGEPEQELTPITAYNFLGNRNALSNITPQIDYGWTKVVREKTFHSKSAKKAGIAADKTFQWILSINPYVAGQVQVKDSSTFIPALLMPGNGGFRFNSFLVWEVGKEGKFSFSPMNVAIKLITNFTDSNRVIVQHNIRPAIIYRYAELIQVGVQYTYGWHNSSSNSTENFKTFFKKSATDIQYLHISFAIRAAPTNAQNPTFVFGEWRKLLNQKDYPDYPNKKFFQIGIKKKISLNDGSPGKSPL